MSDKELRIDADRAWKWMNGTRNDAIVVDGRGRACARSAGNRGGMIFAMALMKVDSVP